MSRAERDGDSPVPETPAEEYDGIPNVDAVRYDTGGRIAFVRCAGCGAWRVNGSGHDCDGTHDRDGRPKKPNTEFREALRDADRGDPDDTMVLLTTGSVCAYHEARTDDEGNVVPACRTGTAGHTAADRWRQRRRGHLWTRQPVYPCRDCHETVHERAVERLGWEPVG